jgi:hypothetical protein
LAKGPFALAVAGGVLAGSKRLREQLTAELQRIGLSCGMRVVEEPLEGCLRLADPEFSDQIVDWQ